MSPTALIVIIARSGERASVEFPTNRHFTLPGGWFPAAMRDAVQELDADASLSRIALGGSEVVRMVVIDGDGDVLNYNASEALELLGGAL